MYFLFLLVALFFSTNLSAQKPILLCEKSTYNFGKIMEADGTVKHTFIIKNVGKLPLVLDYCTASCGCTDPTWTKKPIAPGKTGVVNVTFDPKDSEGVFLKTIWIYSNATKKATTLLIKGEVIPKGKK